MAAQKRYDMDFKKQAVRLAKEIGGKKAARELNVSPVSIRTVQGLPHKTVMYTLPDHPRML